MQTPWESLANQNIPRIAPSEPGKPIRGAPEQIVLGNGSNELIELIVRAFLRPGEEAIIPHPSFVVYPMIVQAAGGIRVVTTLKDYSLDLEAMARAITPLTKLVFIANPNNPTATIVTAAAVERFMAGS